MQPNSGSSLFQFAARKTHHSGSSLAAADAELKGPNEPVNGQNTRIRYSRRSKVVLFAFGTGMTESFEVIDGFIRELHFRIRLQCNKLLVVL